MSESDSSISPILLSPGVAALHPAVRSACCRQIINPRGGEFVETYRSIESRLQAMLGTRQDVLLIGGNGTQAMELAVANTVSPGDPVLVVSQGEFGNRFIDILRSYGASVHVLRVPPGSVVSTEELQSALFAAGRIHACFLVHVETSVGTRCDLQNLAAVVRQSHPNALIVVDCMTSLAAHEIRFDEWDIDVVVSAGHKAIGGPVGISFVGFSDRAWRICERSCNTGFWGNLTEMRRFHRQGQSRHVLPLPSFFGLAAALDLIDETGLQGFRRHLAGLAGAARTGLGESGLQLVVPSSSAARTVTCAWLPEDASVTELVQFLRDECGVEIATGRGQGSNRMIRIGHLGLATNLPDLNSALNAIRNCLYANSATPVPA